ncbi:MAG: hypothetical protein B7Y88_10625 [Sphingomonadales bacterium 32-64-17]|nr:MAG: hypothetical protein B7Y88_10625 [Sphingomonadales bacterium 32-64-17]
MATRAGKVASPPSTVKDKGRAQLALDSVGSVDFAYQPIVSTKTLAVHGFEALARTTATPFASIIDLLEAMSDTRDLQRAESAILDNAIAKFACYEAAASTRLFCNLDGRLYEGDCLSPDLMRDLLRPRSLPPGAICLEISERYQLRNWTNLIDLSKQLSGCGMHTALDDFGTGMSGLHLLLRVEPNYVKIDQSFVFSIATNQRQQAVVSKLCGLAHSLGFQTVAEGVECEEDFRMVRDLGCDFAQGYHIARPTTELRKLTQNYTRCVTQVTIGHMDEDVGLLLNKAPPMLTTDSLAKLETFFEENPDLPLAPAIDETGMLVGVVYEEDFFSYRSSEFGRALMANKASAPRIGSFVRNCPIAHATGSVEQILNSYVDTNSARGIMLADEGAYVGYLSNHALMRLALDRAVSIARDANPLTQLPGNRAITRKLGDVTQTPAATSIVYFDFDHFKAFNDCYGFSMGDRALMMFADQLKDVARRTDLFAAHIGGDDFFLAVEAEPREALQIIQEIRAKFASDASSLYSAEDRERGGILALDRYGSERLFPMLRVSASVLHLPAGTNPCSIADIEERLSRGKKQAKRAPEGIAIVALCCC